METSVRKLRGKYRIVEKGTNKLARHPNGNLMDGGGYLAKYPAENTKKRIDSMDISVWRRRAAVFAAVVCLLFIIWAAPSEAQAQAHSVDPGNDECWAIGILIEVAEDTTDEARRERQWVAWYRLAHTKEKQRIVKYARNAFVNGVTSDQMYRRCASI
jgi:hypothetical protein